MTRRYSELVEIPTFRERFLYLQLSGGVGHPTFGSERYLNQRFYTSTEWRNLRHHIIARDLGNDLGMEGFPIHSKLVIHHMNPMTTDDISAYNQDILNPEYLITTTHDTHNSIHYGDERTIRTEYQERRPGDTRLW